MPKEVVDYSNTIIYKISCNNQDITDIYVGHTTNFIKRKYQHKTCCNNLNNKLKIYKIIRENGGWNNWDMVEIAKYNCKDHTEARIKELEHYEELKASLNSIPPYTYKKQYFCETCQQNCSTKSEYEKHMQCNLHKKKCEIIEDNEKNAENANLFYCVNCDFKCFKKSNYETHLLTSKHQKHENDTENDKNDNGKMPENASAQFVCECGKTYKYSSGLSRHKNAKNCSPTNTFNTLDFTMMDDDSDVKMLTNLVLEVVKQNQELICQNTESQKQNQELQKHMLDICKNGTSNTTITNSNNNSNNKTFNLNVFLNETCKDAMNIMDFVDSVKLQMSDLESLGRLGFVEGMSNIILKNLKALDVHKRPVHCSDSKREVMYVKDQDKWEKEGEEKIKIRKAIKKIANKNYVLIPQFKELHPDCNKSSSPYSDQYNKIIIEAMGGSGNEDFDNENKIIRKIAKEVTINKS